MLKQSSSKRSILAYAICVSGALLYFAALFHNSFSFYLCIRSFVSIGRLHAAREGMKLKKTPEDMQFVVSLMDWLENNNCLKGVPQEERSAILYDFISKVSYFGLNNCSSARIDGVS